MTEEIVHDPLTAVMRTNGPPAARPPATQGPEGGALALGLLLYREAQVIFDI